MPIWSLTKERVEKLLKQVGDKELEIDTLLKLTKEDLWKRDLDEFIAEWRFQLEDEAKRQKKISSLNRRASSKMGGGGGGGRKRKGAESDYSDFEGPAKPKKAPKQPKPVGGLLSYLAPPPAKTKASDKPKAPSAAAKAAQKTLNLLEAPKESVDDIWMSLDGSGDDVHRAPKTRTAAPLKKAATQKQVVADDDEDEEIVRPTATRQPRAAAAKPVKYNTLDSDSDGEDMLFDVGKMVKGIDTTSADKSRQLFAASASRPSSSSGLPKKPAPSKQTFDMDADDTNYSMLVPPAAAKGPAVTAREAILSEDEDSMEDMVYAPKASKPKPAPKAAPKPKAPAKKAAKAVSQPPEPKKNILSPVGKAYAAMRAKQAKKADSEDEVEKIADEIMDDEEEEDDDEAPAARRPGRRAAAAPKKWVISDDEDEDEGVTADFDNDDDSDD